MLRIGHGFDVHRFAEGRRCILGGVDVKRVQYLMGHASARITLEIYTKLMGSDLQDTASAVRTGFQRRMAQDLGMTGNAYFADATDSTAITHYCSVENCTNPGTLVAEDALSRSYYCEDHRSEYEEDSRVQTQEP